MEFEQYKEELKIVEWRDNSIFRTQSIGYRWITDTEINANKPKETNIIYAVPNHGDPNSKYPDVMIRRKG